MVNGKDARAGGRFQAAAMMSVLANWGGGLIGHIGQLLWNQMSLGQSSR